MLFVASKVFTLPTSGRYKPELNPTNVLGCGGTIAKQWANLLQELYKSDPQPRSSTLVCTIHLWAKISIERPRLQYPTVRMCKLTQEPYQCPWMRRHHCQAMGQLASGALQIGPSAKICLVCTIHLWAKISIERPRLQYPTVRMCKLTQEVIN
jgi:hypothetical protein